MKTISINNFGGGMAKDIYAGEYGEFSSSRQFDLFTYPNRLFPIPGMQNNTSGTGIDHILVGKNYSSAGAVYGLGQDVAAGSPSIAAIWINNGSTWTQNTKISAAKNTTSNRDLFIEYIPNGTNSILASVDTGIGRYDPTNAQTAATEFLTYVTMTQGCIHPKDKILYYAYTTSSASYIGLNNAGTYNHTALALPSQYRPTSVSYYGNYLAVSCTYYSVGEVAGSNVDNSIVVLWDRDTSNTLPNEIISWGNNTLKIINNLNGVLIGVSAVQNNETASLLVKGFNGGEPEVLTEICVTRQDPATSPSVTIYQRVNFVYRDRLTFSADLVGGGTSPSHKGLWYFGKVKGKWVLFVGQYASVDGTDKSVIAGANYLGYLYAVHTSAGTTVSQLDGNTLSTGYDDTSYWESVVNPNMPDADKVYKKKLLSVAVHTLPLTTSGQVVFKCRVDSIGDWITIFTKTSTSPDTNLVAYETQILPSMQIADGRNFEFRVESTGGAQIHGITYRYEVLETNI